MLRIKLVKSPIGNTKRNRAIVASLGLRKVQQVVEHEDVPSIRGMVHKVKHLLQVEEVEGAKASNGKAAPTVEEKPKAARAKKEKAPAAEPEIAEVKE